MNLESIRVQTRRLKHQSTIMYHSRHLSITWWRPWDKSRHFDISKAFDKVLHEGLLFKLKQNGISGNLLNVITDFMDLREQRVVLNGQHSSWNNVQTGVSQGSILGPLFFLIYINDWSGGLTSNPKLFVDDTSLVSVVQNINSTANDLNSDLIKISDWAFQWKIKFNPGPKKQAQEVIFSRKITKIDHPPLYFNENLVK